MSEGALDTLISERYISLTTFRRDGRAVATPVWFVCDGARLLVWTGASTGKAKRIRNNPAVTVAACTMRGAVAGPAFAARATILPDGEGTRIQALLNRKYGLTKRLLDLFNGVMRRVRRRRPVPSAYLEIRPAD